MYNSVSLPAASSDPRAEAICSFLAFKKGMESKAKIMVKIHYIELFCYCAGMAGDRGMRYPELTGAALQHIQTNGCTDGYSTSRTCEISLSNHSGINFRGLVYLADEATKPKQQQQHQAA